jgi:hypothetical protein
MIPEQNHDKIRQMGHRWIDISAGGCALVVSMTSLFVAIPPGQSMERMAEAKARLVEANSYAVSTVRCSMRAG